MSSAAKCELGCRKRRTMFRFPENESRRLQWFKATKLEYSIKKYMWLCRKHFSQHQLKNKRLQNDAVPDKFLSVQSDDDKSSETEDDEVAMEFNELVSVPAAVAPKRKRDPLIALKTKRKKQVDKRTATPMATLEMKLITKEWEKVDKLPKLPTGKLPTKTSSINQTKPIAANADMSNNATVAVEPSVQPIQLPASLKLPKCITIKKANSNKVASNNIVSNEVKALSSSESTVDFNDWEIQAKEMRAKVEEKLKTLTGGQNAINKEKARSFAEDENINYDFDQCDSFSTLTEIQKDGNLETLICDEILPNDDALSGSDVEVISIYKQALSNDETLQNKNDFIAKKYTFDSKTSEAISKDLQECGYVQHCSADNTFNITCFWCPSSYQLCNWERFVEHFTKFHKLENSFDATKTPLLTESNTDLLTNAASFENSCFESDASLDIVEDDLSIISFPNEERHQDNAAQLNLETTDTERVLRFLETLESHAVLWHIRRLEPTIWDEEANAFLTDFDPDMSLEEFRKSMKVVHAFYQRFTPLTARTRLKLKQSSHFRVYLKKLQEIVKLSESCAYYCDQCPFYYLNEDRLTSHKYTKHGIGELAFACRCGLYFESADKRAAHEAKHKKPFVCECCGLAFELNSKLKRHRLLKHPEVVENKTYECTICEAQFSLQSTLKSHLLWKHQAPRFKCEQCGKTFKASFNYKTHLKRHANQRDYICDECGKGFFNNKCLQDHKQKHQPLQYRCRHCYQSFNAADKLNKHNEKYHPNGANLDRVRAHRRKMARLKAELSGKLAMGRKKRELKCKQCGVRFERMRDLLRHKRELNHRLGEKRYRCPHCGSILSSKLTFLRHLCHMHKLPVKAADLKDYEPLDEESEERFTVKNEQYEATVDSDAENIDQDILQDNEIFDEMFEEYLSENENEHEIEFNAEI